MEFGVREYVAIGFPLLVGILLAVLYPLKLKDYFSPQDIKYPQARLKQDYSIKEVLYVFTTYIISTAILGLIQAYLFWHFAVNPEIRFVSRFTDFILYPFIVSAFMAVFVMWFVFSCRVYSKGSKAVRDFLRRSYEGWGMMREVGRFKYLVLAAGLACTAANFWIYNIYLIVTDDAIVVSDHKILGSHKFNYDIIEYFRIEWHRNSNNSMKRESFVLGVKLEDGGVARTDENMLYNKNMLHQIDRIIDSSIEASGRNFQVVFTEFPRTKSNEVRGLFSQGQ
ncbi:MAG: hypothetical protein DHS20C13_02500 [Thermodesulfobacteriota bacterium]|nr:MAG: hypothetical protein DHS20C13_02500 [Thermodesulfobacteriota bacterium]